ncbi:MAG: hypothetical protein AB1443_05090 [Pseudomonadota bacterium]
MTRNEKRILAPLVRKIIDRNRYYWLELKRQIWDLGFQLHYDAETEFLDDIERAVNLIPPETKVLLVAEWNSARPARDQISESGFVAAYTMLILEEIVSLATMFWFEAILANWAAPPGRPSGNGRSTVRPGYMRTAIRFSVQKLNGSRIRLQWPRSLMPISVEESRSMCPTISPTGTVLMRAIGVSRYE